MRKVGERDLYFYDWFGVWIFRQRSLIKSIASTSE